MIYLSILYHVVRIDKVAGFEVCLWIDSAGAAESERPVLNGALEGFPEAETLSGLSLREGKADILHALKTVRGDGVGLVTIQVTCHCVCPVQRCVNVSNGGGLIVLVRFAGRDGEGCVAFADLEWSAWTVSSM